MGRFDRDQANCRSRITRGGRAVLSVVAALLAASVLGCAHPVAESADAHQGEKAEKAEVVPRKDYYRQLPRIALGAAFDRYGKPGDLPPGHSLTAAGTARDLRRLERSSIAVQWIGHATLLIRIGGKIVLTDPFFAKRLGLAPGAGPTRLVPPALAVQDLPQIDLIILSHGDHDHWDDAAAVKLAQRNRDTLVVVPPGNGSLARLAGFRNVIELSTNETARLDSLKVTAVPAYHLTKRELFPHEHRGHSGFELAAGGYKLLFAGDTAYGPGFRDVRRRRGRFDAAIVPIGAYEPRELVGKLHVNPEEAIRIARDVGADTAIAMHWGTLALTPEPVSDPPKRFRAAAGRGVVPVVLRIGETVVLLE